jgi:hypothetical protein
MTLVFGVSPARLESRAKNKSALAGQSLWTRRITFDSLWMIRKCGVARSHFQANH